MDPQSSKPCCSRVNYIWLLESENKVFVKKFVLQKGTKLFSSREYCPEYISHMVGKNLVMPACKFIVRKLVRQDAERKFEKVPFSRTVIVSVLMICHKMLKRFCIIN